jgi:ABC-type multidrug transport system fused ATPase/permease subunit
MHQNVLFFNQNKTGDLINRLSNDVEVMAKALSGPNLSSGLRSIVQGIGCFALMAKISPELMGLVSAAVPIVGGLGWVYGKFIKKLQEQIQAAQGGATTVAEEIIANIRTVKAFAAEENEMKRYSRSVEEVLRQMQRTALAGSSYHGVTQVVGYSCLLTVFVYGTQLNLSGHMSVGDLTSFVLYTIYLGMSLVGGSNFYGEIMKGLGSGMRVLSVIDLDRSPQTGKILDDLKGQISFRNVDFAYPDRSEHKVFSGLDFDISAGEIIALVGQSGSGKSTVSNLLLKFFNVDSGYITIDGVNVNELNSKWLRERIGIVSQEPVLFSGSILDNIRYGKPDATEDDIIEAARKSNSYDFIMNFPDKFNTNVGERGVSLSGGQKQRIAIARAILKNPSILILDEATSALDAESERLVQDALDRLMKDRTTLIIAHRLSTIQSANRIIVLKDKKVGEQGSAEELLSRSEGGLFHQILQQNSKSSA